MTCPLNCSRFDEYLCLSWLDDWIAPVSLLWSVLGTRFYLLQTDNQGMMCANLSCLCQARFPVVHLCAFISRYCLWYVRICVVNLFPGKPGGYDRVRNAEIGNKVRKVWTSVCPWFDSALLLSLHLSFVPRTLSWMFWKRRIPQSTGLCASIKSRT